MNVASRTSSQNALTLSPSDPNLPSNTPPTSLSTSSIPAFHDSTQDEDIPQSIQQTTTPNEPIPQQEAPQQQPAQTTPSSTTTTTTEPSPVSIGGGTQGVFRPTPKAATLRSGTGIQQPQEKKEDSQVGKSMTMRGAAPPSSSQQPLKPLQPLLRPISNPSTPTTTDSPKPALPNSLSNSASSDSPAPIPPRPVSNRLVEGFQGAPSPTPIGSRIALDKIAAVECSKCSKLVDSKAVVEKNGNKYCKNCVSSV